MNYLFFDVEGANCYNFVSKMCTFGYVIVDEKFQVKSKIDVVMNPDSPFDKHIIKENMNAYPLSYYSTRPPFNYFYKSIKNILQTHKYIIGWSIENDVKYIYDGCKRYNLKQIEYSYLDLQKVYMDVYELSSQPSLETICNENNIQIDTIHKSDDDAYLTMLLTKKICEKLKLTIEQLFEKYSNFVSNVKEFSSHMLSNDEIKKRINRRKIVNTMKTAKRKKNLQDDLINENDVYGFDIHVIDNYAEDVRKLIRYIVDCGAKCSSNFQECTAVINLRQNESLMFGKAKSVDFYKIIKSLKEPIKNK